MYNECYGCAHSLGVDFSEDICKVCMRNPSPNLESELCDFKNGFAIQPTEDMYISPDRLRLEIQGFSYKLFAAKKWTHEVILSPN